MKTKVAVCALIYRGDRILGVSRKYDLTMFGLIGGKVDEGEDMVTALYRETKEETGLEIIKHTPIFDKIDDDGYHCFTFLCEVTGEVTTNEKGLVAEITWDILFNGPFGIYNKALYKKINNE